MSLAAKARQADARGNHYEAELLYTRALGLVDVSAPSTHSTLADLWNGMGELCFHMGKFDDAEQWFGKALDLSMSIRDLKAMATSRENLARVQRAKSELLKAKALKMLGAPDDMRCDNYSVCLAFASGPWNSLDLPWACSAQEVSSEPLIYVYAEVAR